MVTNVTVAPVDNVVVIYYQDMSTETVEPQTTKSFQLVENGFCTISETVNAEAGEHPDQTLPTDDDIPEFAEKLLRFWKDFIEAFKKKAHDATPL